MRVVFPITDRVKTFDDLPAGHEMMHSIVRGRNDFDLPVPPDPGTPEFEAEADTFLKVRTDVVNGVWPDWYFEGMGIDPEPPAMFREFGVTRETPEAAVRLVDHAMDHRLDLHNLFLEYHGNPPILPPETQQERSPEQTGHDFLGAVWLETEVAVNTYQALVEVFQTKYYFVRVRPEHYFRAGRLVAAYKCPPHPAYGAGHGAIAGATFATWEQFADIEPGAGMVNRHAAQHYAHYRTFAGVHWPSDNTIGFAVGQLKTEGRYQ